MKGHASLNASFYADLGSTMVSGVGLIARLQDNAGRSLQTTGQTCCHLSASLIARAARALHGNLGPHWWEFIAPFSA